MRSLLDVFQTEYVKCPQLLLIPFPARPFPISVASFGYSLTALDALRILAFKTAHLHSYS